MGFENNVFLEGIKLDSLKVFNKDYGDVVSLEDIIEDNGMMYSDSDGVWGEVLLNGNVVIDKVFSTSTVLYNKSALKDLEEKHGKVSIVWYNN